jgi:hypothetical protein
MSDYNIVILGFKTEYTNGKERDKVLFAPRASAASTQTWEYINHIRPDPAKIGTISSENRNMKLAAMTAFWEQIEPAYKAWKEGYEAPANGTSLRSWPALQQDQIEALMRGGVRSIEDLAGCPDHALARIQLPGLQSLKRQAAEFLKNTDKHAIAKQLADSKAANEALAEQLQAAMELLEEMKPKRGRPRKDASEPELIETADNEAA